MIEDLEIPEIPTKKPVVVNVPVVIPNIEQNVPEVKKEVVSKPLPKEKEVPISPAIDPKIEELTNILGNLEFFSNQVNVNIHILQRLDKIIGLLEKVDNGGI